jgi:hypothetical protein
MTQLIVVALLLGVGIAVVVGLFLLNRNAPKGGGSDSGSNAPTGDAGHHASGDGGDGGGGDGGGGDGGGD